jgi:ABC-type multidrug transport system ATPase subunit
VAPPALRLRGVRKAYGRRVALDGLDLTVPAGALCGLIGPNGAGKTTAFGIIGGVVRPDAGEVDLLGEGPFTPVRHRGRVTLLPQDAALPAAVPLRSMMRFYAQLQGMTAGAATRAADAVLDEVGLADRAGSRVDQLSHGMKRRAAVAQALLGAPALVLLDEPTAGLDPDLVVRMRNLLRSRRGSTTLVVSSHVLLELEAICDHVVFLESGRCVREGPLAEIAGAARVLRVVFSAPVAPEAAARAFPGRAASGEGTCWSVPLHPGESAPAGLRSVLEAAWAIGLEPTEVRSGEGLEAAWLAGRISGSPPLMSRGP